MQKLRNTLPPKYKTLIPLLISQLRKTKRNSHPLNTIEQIIVALVKIKL